MKLSGMRFAVSGRFTARLWTPAAPRAQIEALVRAWGGEFGPVGAKTTHTLVGTNAGRTVGEALDTLGFCALFTLERDDLLALFTDPAARARFDLAVELLETVPMADLDGADLRGMRLERVAMEETSLIGVDLRGGGLPGCSVGSCTRARFDGANLQCAHLLHGGLRASFRGADLGGAELRGDFRHADFTGARLAGATFGTGALEGAVFDDVGGATFCSDLKGVSLRGLDLTETTFKHALDGADLTGATLCLPHPVDLRGCDLTNATFVRSCLDTADLRGAIIDGTDFSGATLAFARFGPPKGRGRVGPAVKKLLETFPDHHFRTSLNVVLDDAVVHVLLSTSPWDHPIQLQWSLRGQPRHGRSEDLADIARWLSQGEVKLEGMTAGMRRDAWPPSPVKPKVGRELAMAAWCELFDVQPTDGAAARSRVKKELAAHQDTLDVAGEARLLALVQEDPDDLERWKIYADWLTEQGDVRGQIILREHAEPDGWGRVELADRLVRAHGDAVLGELASMQGAHFHFRNAFIDKIHLAAGKNAVRLCRILAKHPSTRLARVIHTDTVAQKVFAPLFALVAARPFRRFSLAWTRLGSARPLEPLTHLRELALSGTYVTDLAPLAALENLEVLEMVRMRRPITLGPIASLPLKKLVLVDTQVRDPEVEGALKARGVVVERRRH